MVDLRDDVRATEKLGGSGGWPEAGQACLSRPQDGEWTGTRLSCHRRLVPPPGNACAVLVRHPDDDDLRLVVIPLERHGVSVQPVPHVADEPRFDLRIDCVATVADVVAHGPQLQDILVEDGLRRAGYLLGLASGALDLTVRRVRERKQFGISIGGNQSVAFSVAAIAARIAAARAFTEDAARVGRYVTGLWRHVAVLARDATALAVHLHGAHGLTFDSAAQHFYRQALLHTASEPALEEQ